MECSYFPDTIRITKQRYVAEFNNPSVSSARFFREPASSNYVAQPEAANRLASLPVPVVDIEENEPDILMSARGWVVGVIGGVALWGVIGFCIWSLLGS
jgi:hypothetical protein